MNAAAHAAPAPMTSRQVIRLRNFRLVWLAQGISDLGDGLTNLTLLLMVNSLTGSTAALALMAIVLAVPPMTIGLVAGVYVDRLDRRKVMLAADLLRVAIVLGFIVVRSADQIWILYLLAFVEATVGTFFTPARTALVPALVPAEGLMAANGLSQASRVIAATMGAAGAGVLFGLAGSAWPAFVADSLTFGLSFLLILQVRAPASDTNPAATSGSAAEAAKGEGEGKNEGVRAELVGGLRTIAQSPILVGSLISIGVLMLGLGAVNVLFIPLLIGHLHVAPTWIGLVDLAQTSSMVLSALFISRIVGRRKPTSIVTFCLAGTALLVLLLAGTTALWQVLLLLFVVGWLVSPLNAAASTIIQTSVPRRSMGRVGAALNAVMSGASIASMAAAGLLAAILGVQAVLFIAGAVTGASALVAWILFRRIPSVTTELTERPVTLGDPHWEPE